MWLAWQRRERDGRYKHAPVLSERASVVGPGAVCVLWGPCDLSFVSVKLYWLQELFPDSCHLKGDQHVILKQVCSSDVSYQLHLQGIPGGWGKRLYIGGVAPKWKKKCFGKIRPMPSTLHSVDLSFPQHWWFPKHNYKNIQIDFTRSLHMYTYYSPVNDRIIFWNDPLMIWFE